MSTAHYEVVVVGGGMVGTALARALGRQGRRVALIEAHKPQPWHVDEDYDLRVSAINRASQHLFEHLGAWSGMRARRVSAYRRMHVWDAGGAGAISFDAAEIGEPDLGHIVENRVIQEALGEGLEGVAQYCPVALEAMTIDGTQVRLLLTDGIELSAALVVGADGAHSRVRALAGIEREERPYGQKAIVTTLSTERSHQDTAWQRFLSTGPVALLPLADGRCSLVWSADTAVADGLMALSDDDFRLELGRATALCLGCVTEIGARAAFPLVGSRVRPYVRPRIALVGDAAHTIHPLAGQGVNLGFMDVAALAGVLGGTRREVGGLRVLRAYERARRAENEGAMRVMEGFKQVFGSGLPGLAWLRGQGLALAGGIPPLKRRLASQALMGGHFTPPTKADQG
ncbi:2-octaprenyl-3-methyl-6-methoxy-1,4-benzoquinol hydroxylase [Acidihalobacter yilgarnensis]|uniref:2-octaprenyl-3-methyl-6-methoxy-1,4-benzoquinol hydroxylase n=1 Tax=Acidihalobacter yilgarnensis TaxID=2819280 RepID=A0A1D8IKB9_9GAMM|nr:UbiH/UbiF/VisC/COQ6 family ubiquinone biosynthesis hydroxylase [Acidihalobacter yilgarnensis]AOU96905.1 2-octaprenyl-3-methyl-6-methoxy-1,4-benzoquinol hydroxylase [Acidihalobacter yilgarnensis]